MAARLAGTRWSRWRAAPIAADASARRYARLMSDDGEAVIMMDAPPSAGESTHSFAKMTQFLRLRDLAAPEILLHDSALGLMVIEDLGQTDFARHLSDHPQDAAVLYEAATACLIHLDGQSAPAELSRLDPATAGKMVDITAEWYCDGINGNVLSRAITQHMKAIAPDADTIALRDFHAENLIWRSDKSGLHKVGLLDYQDAFIAPAGYDLASLLHDVRRDVDPDLVQHLVTHFAKATNRDPEQFAAQFALLSAQRNLRILGVFARLILRDDKMKYAAFVPRVWAHIQTALAHPELAELARTVYGTLPPPDQSHLKDAL
ncbi:aminoglycoside phosphotransferase family protein [Yoonia sp. 208BN28-4]|uniref:aminoglycoside phosphotransferase family protein n=1 Tax=Yoonia sp. 208BN28-4 TaxID=3126505 RepID=UPI0030EBBA82